MKIPVSPAAPAWRESRTRRPVPDRGTTSEESTLGLHGGQGRHRHVFFGVLTVLCICVSSEEFATVGTSGQSGTALTDGESVAGRTPRQAATIATASTGRRHSGLRASHDTTLRVMTVGAEKASLPFLTVAPRNRSFSILTPATRPHLSPVRGVSLLLVKTCPARTIISSVPRRRALLFGSRRGPVARPESCLLVSGGRPWTTDFVAERAFND
jgi:hypothetical protein